MQQSTGKPDADPQWFAKAVHHYALIKDGAHTIRSLAREKNCHPSTILRQTRKIERLADTKAVQQALHRLRTNKDEMPQYSSALGMCSATAELQKLLHFLEAPDCFVVMAENLPKAVIIRDHSESGPKQIGIVSAETAQAAAMQGLIARRGSGKVAKYFLAPKSRNEPLGFSEANGKFHLGSQEKGSENTETVKRTTPEHEKPMAILARRRDIDGRPFLNKSQLVAAQRLSEDYAIANLCPAQDIKWDEYISSATVGPHSKALPALTKVAAALQALGPGLGDIALRCCCFEEGLETSEKSLGWAARSGKIVLRIALTALDRHYRDTYGPGGGIIS